MNIVDFPRIKLAHLPTPLQKMENLSKLLNGPQLYIKRDDMTGLLLGGNKARKLEFLMGNAIQKGVDLIITAGRTQSNWAAQATAAARKLGMEAFLVLCGDENEPCQGNYLLCKIMGAKFKFISLDNYQNHLDEIMEDISESYCKQGKKPYVIPRGGSTPLADLGYVNGVLELLYQANQINLRIDYIVLAAGSCGTMAGLITGLRGCSSNIKTLGVTVGRPKRECISRITTLNEEIADLLGPRFRVDKNEIIIYDQYIGEGYGKRTEESIQAIETVVKKEGILLDPVYTGKTMAGLIDLIKKREFNSNQNIVFLHTGGSGGLFGHNNYFI